MLESQRYGGRSGYGDAGLPLILSLSFFFIMRSVRDLDRGVPFTESQVKKSSMARKQVGANAVALHYCEKGGELGSRRHW
jgi:hypothetical protein